MTSETISPEALYQLVKTGVKVHLIDVRTPAEFRQIHVPYAANFPLETLNPARIVEEHTANGGGPLYVICQSGARAAQACRKLLAAGATHVVNVERGTLGCEEDGLELTRGQQTISLERQVRIAAGSLVLLGTILGFTVDKGFYGLSAFIGAGLVFAGITDTCGMGMLIARMPWNQVSKSAAPAACSIR